MVRFKDYILSAGALLLLQTHSNAQFNDTVHYYAGIVSTGTINNTDNSSSYISDQAMKIGVKRKDISLNSTSSWVYGMQQRTLTNNDVTSTLDFDLHKSMPHFYYWGLANYTSSFSLKINNQYQAGLGIAYNFIDRKNAQINVSDGILYESSDIYLYDTVRDVYNTYRNSLRLMCMWKIQDKVTINGTAFYQNSFKSSTDYIIRANLSLGIKLKKWLTLTSAYTYNRFNRTKRENTLFTYGLTIENYF